MTQEQKDIWVAALRSGKYKQGHGALTEYKGGIRYDCCLGVANEVLGLGCATGQGSLHKGEDIFLPYAVQRELWHRNDGCGSTPKHSFSEIADYIEKEVGPCEI